jgi:hypothetical protein
MMGLVYREAARPLRQLLRSGPVQSVKHLHYRLATRGDRRRAPRFFLVGAPHAGSTSLYAYMGQHPQIWMSRRKEPNFFRSRRVGIGWTGAYLALFAEAGPEHRVLGEASPWYLYDRNAASRIRRASPASRIAILLRDPIGRAVSQFQYRLRMTGAWPADPVSRFREHVALEARLPHSSQGGRGHELRAGLYDTQVRRYLDRFGSEQVHVVLAEELDAEPRRALSELFRFLEVDEDFTPDTRVRHNPAPAEQRIRLPRDLHATLSEYFAADVDSLSRTLDRDLSHWLASPRGR